MYRKRCFNWSTFILKTLQSNAKNIGILPNIGSKASITFFSSNNGQIIGHTNLLAEDAPKIRELPVIVRRAPDLGLSGINRNRSRNDKSAHTRERRHAEEKEMIDGFQRCTSFKNLVNLLELIPQEEMSPAVALHALRTITELENNKRYRNVFPIEVENDQPAIKYTVINRLIDFIVVGEDPHHVMEALREVSKDANVEEAAACCQKLTDNILIRIFDDELSLDEILECVKFLVKMGCNEEYIDKIWIGIIEREHEINEGNLVSLYTLLLQLSFSRELFLSILLTHTEDMSFNLEGKDIVEILYVINEIQYFNPRLTECITTWLKLNLIDVSEDVLLNIIKAYTMFPHTDENFIRLIGRYFNRNGRKMSNTAIVASAMDYCNAHKIRSSLIFEYCSDHFVRRADNLSPQLIKSIILPFGLLNFQPSNGAAFWSVLEKKLSENFIQFCPNDVLDIMLVHIYLGKYPDYLVSKVFHPYFLNRLKSIKNPNELKMAQIKLKIVYMALTLEKECYIAPNSMLNPLEVTIREDCRIREMRSELLKILPNILDCNQDVTGSVPLKRFPHNAIYNVDVMIHPISRLSYFNIEINHNHCAALLIHTPDHYDRSGQFLIGSQVMKKRHLNMCGFKTVDLNYNILQKLLANKYELKKYIKNEINNSDSFHMDN